MIQALTFDCYGTLIDWETGFRQSAADILRGRMDSLPLRDLWHLWEKIESERCEGPYRAYHAIISEAFEEAVGRLEIPLQPGDGERFAQRFPTWGPFPDVKPALTPLKGKVPLYIFSNSDDEILNLTILKIGVRFDGTMTATRARVYKPNPEIFRKAIEVHGLEPQKTLHISYTERVDLRVAKELGFQTGWLKRGIVSLSPDFKPDFVLGTLEDLPGIVSV